MFIVLQVLSADVVTIALVTIDRLVLKWLAIKCLRSLLTIS